MEQRERQTGLRQAERYGGPASAGARSEAQEAPRRGPPSAAAAYKGGFAMIAATLLAGWLGAPALLAFLIGLAVFAAVVLASRPGGFGLAPAPLEVDRAAATAAGVDPDRAAARLAEAERRLARIDMTAAGLDDRPLEAVLREMTAELRRTLAALAADPGDIDRAKKFLIVTIPSAEASVDKFAALGVRDQQLSQRFETLMKEVTEAARRQRAALARDDTLALEVEMEVLSDRLRQG